MSDYEIRNDDDLKLWFRIKSIEKKIDNAQNITYEGQAEDVEGKAFGSISGNTLNWSYDIYLNINRNSYVILSKIL